MTEEHRLTVTPHDAATAISRLTRVQQPGCLWGPSGIGKSEIIHQAAAMLGMRVVDLRGSLLDAVDLRGVPHVVQHDDGYQTRWATPVFLPRVGDPPTLLFLDEITRALMPVQNALLQLTRDRRLGEYVLPSNCAIMAASNYESDAGVTRLSAAAGSRFMHLWLETSVDDWLHWASENGIGAITIALINFRRDLLHCPPTTKGEMCWPNPRAWAIADEVAKEPMPTRVRMALVAGIVGQGAMVEYEAMVKRIDDLVSIDAILLDPAGAKVPTDTATLYAVCAALASRADANNYDRIMAYAERLPAEYGVCLVKDSIAREPTLAKTPEFTRWAIGHADLL